MISLSAATSYRRRGPVREISEEKVHTFEEMRLPLARLLLLGEEAETTIRVDVDFASLSLLSTFTRESEALRDGTGGC